MGSVNKSASKDVAFDSKDIITKSKAGQKKEYFVKFKNKTTTQKSSELFHKHKKKTTVIMCTILVAAVAVFAAIKIISMINQPKEKNVAEWSEEILSTGDEIDQYLEDMQNSDSDTPYTDTIQHFEELYDQETDPDKKFALLIAQIRYLTDKEDYKEAEKLMAFAVIPNPTDEQTYLYAVAAYNLYTKEGNREMADFYYSIIEELSGTDEGGPQYED